MNGRTNAVAGTKLPALTNPAAAGNIQSGYQAINGEGEVVTGTAEIFSYATVTINTSLQTNGGDIFYSTGFDYIEYKGSSGTIRVLVGSMIIITGTKLLYSGCTGNLEPVEATMGYLKVYGVFVNGDGTINFG